VLGCQKPQTSAAVLRAELPLPLATHQELGSRLGHGGQVAIGQEQLEALRALGYID